MAIRIGNAPVSFGVFEPEFGETKQLPWYDVLDMIAKSGYQGAELGPYGYMPTDPRELAEEMKKRNLKLASSFVPLDLANRKVINDSIQKMLTVAVLLNSQDVPWVIVADVGNEERLQNAGSHPEGWTDIQWQSVKENLDAIANAVNEQYGMTVVIHHHAGTFLETPDEIERVLDLTDPGKVNLLLDTGHYVYGGGDPIDLIRRRGDRIKYYHFKDIDIDALQRVRTERIHYHKAARENVFVPLGQGGIDFKTLVKLLKENNYSGWIIVENDTVADDDGCLTPPPFQSAVNSREYLKNLGL
jgi:inosose dehydratase